MRETQRESYFKIEQTKCTISIFVHCALNTSSSLSYTHCLLLLVNLIFIYDNGVNSLIIFFYKKIDPLCKMYTKHDFYNYINIFCPWVKIMLISDWSLVFILDGHSEIGAHVRSYL